MESHLLQMRGLKHRRTPTEMDELSFVASFTDAWIETTVRVANADWWLSHLLQMRGLKPTVHTCITRV